MTSLTRDDAGVNKVQRYTPWGETRTDGGLGTDHTYTGQIEDTTTGLRFYNARYIDPVLGRFVSPDTIVPNPSNGQDYNRYTYVLNNPIRYNDPTGHEPCEGIDILAQLFCHVGLDSNDESEVNEAGKKLLKTLDVYSCKDDSNLGQCIGDVPGSIQTGAGWVAAGCTVAATSGYLAAGALPCAAAAETTAIVSGGLELALDCGGSAVDRSGYGECVKATTDLGFDVVTGPGTQPAKYALESIVTAGKTRSIVGSMVDQFLFDHGVSRGTSETVADIVEKFAPTIFPIVKEGITEYIGLYEDDYNQNHRGGGVQ